MIYHGYEIHTDHAPVFLVSSLFSLPSRTPTHTVDLSQTTMNDAPSTIASRPRSQRHPDLSIINYGSRRLPRVELADAYCVGRRTIASTIPWLMPWGRTTDKEKTCAQVAKTWRFLDFSPSSHRENTTTCRTWPRMRAVANCQ